jgi:alpha-amylase
MRRAIRVRAAVTAGVLAAAALLYPIVHVNHQASASPTGTNDVIANLFMWPWTSVASECTNVLGPKGYGAVQVSPPEDSLSRSGHPWWEMYQPADYNLTSRMGNRSQFAAMVSTCHAAGVKVYADAVINHMTGQGSTSYGGTTFSKYNYPGVYSPADFHYYPANCPESDDQIHSYTVQADVQECELSGLADLDTETDYVRGTVAGYLNDLLGLGVDGFRVDAAKHINDTDITAIESKLTRTAYIYQEVIYGAGEAVQPGMYEGTGDLLEFRYGTNIKSQFQGNIANLKTFGASWGMEPSDKAVVFVDNHDTERNGSTLSYKDGSTYLIADVFELAWNYGTPNIMSSFDFTNSDDSPPSDSNGYVTAPTCGSGWECQQRSRAVENMVGFHNAVKGTSVANWTDDGANLIAFSRGSSGWLTINNGTGSQTRTFATGLAAGTYCDVIHGDYSSGTCGGSTVTVDSSGNTTVTVAAKDSIAIDVNAKVSGGSTSTSTVQATFDEYATTTYGQNVYVVGSIPALGSWNTGSAVALSSASYPTWSTTVTLPANTSFEYKYIKKNTDGSISWESDPNRAASTGTAALTLNDSWR